MVNTDDFIKRLEILLDYYGLSASVFADKMGVQRSGLSHLMSGRNKPSLDFVMKIIENFPEVDLYWLLNGEGSFPKKEGSAKENYTQPVQEQPYPTQAKNESAALDLFSPEENHEAINDSPMPEALPDAHEKSGEKPHKESTVEKIVIFYSDGTFKSYSPGN